MTSEIVMPRMGLTMESGSIVHWLKKEGESVAAGEPLVEIETDKATVEVEALESGILHRIVADIGAEIPVGAVIAYMRKPGEAVDENAQKPTPLNTITLRSAGMAWQPVSFKAVTPAGLQKVKASPAARRLAKSHGVNLERVRGSGPGGRVVAWNVEATVANPAPEAAVRVSPVAQRVAEEMGIDLAGVRGSGPGGAITRHDVEAAARIQALVSSSDETSVEAPGIVPVSRVQRIMAERMTRSFTSAPHFYLHAEVDARQLVSLRDQLLPRLENSDQVHLTFTDLLVYLCGRVLPRHRLVLAQWTPDGLRKFGDVNIGIAVETENGLLVPVLRDADKLGLVEIARRRADLAERARIGKLSPNELEEGVFTITNLGMYGIDSFDAILNPPQAAILAVGRIKQRALAENGQVIAAPMLTLSLSVDHRVLDGARAARFLGELAEMIEAPGLTMR